MARGRTSRAVGRVRLRYRRRVVWLLSSALLLTATRRQWRLAGRDTGALDENENTSVRDGAAEGRQDRPLVRPVTNAGYRFTMVDGCGDHLGLTGHPNLLRVEGSNNVTGALLGDRYANVTFAIVHCNTRHGMKSQRNYADRLLGLPVLTPPARYVVYARGLWLDDCSKNFDKLCKQWRGLFANRSDFLYVMADRGEARICDNQHGMLPGLNVIPSDSPHHNKAANILAKAYLDSALDASNRRLLVFFAGRNHGGWHASSMVRPWLFRSYDRLNLTDGGGGDGAGDDSWDDVLISSTMTSEEYYRTLADTRFALVPRGDGRWNYRLVEILRAGAVPVFLSDGYEAPYAPLIRWETCSIALPEMAALDLAGLRRTLAAIPVERVGSMSRNARAAYDECLATPERRADCLVRSVQLLVEGGAFGRPPVEFAERLDRRLCPRERTYWADDGVVWYENNTFDTWHTLY